MKTQVFFKQFQKDEAAEILKKREAAVKTISTLEQERDLALPKLREALTKAENELNTAQQALQKAEDRYNKTKAKVWGKSHQFEQQINEQRKCLIGTASIDIDEALDFFQLKLEWLRKPGRISRSAQGSILDLVSLKRITTEVSNLSAVNDALRYCQSAIRKLNSLKLEPILDPGTIEMLKNGVPHIDIFSEVKGERPPKKIPVDTTVGTLVKKVGRLVGSPA